MSPHVPGSHSKYSVLCWAPQAPALGQEGCNQPEGIGRKLRHKQDLAKVTAQLLLTSMLGVGMCESPLQSLGMHSNLLPSD
jgi:hypothetical protein